MSLTAVSQDAHRLLAYFHQPDPAPRDWLLGGAEPSRRRAIVFAAGAQALLLEDGSQTESVERRTTNRCQAIVFWTRFLPVRLESRA